MTISYNIPLLIFYGSFLILCGIFSVVFIGKTAKTALISGGMSGILCFVITHFIIRENTLAEAAGIFISLALFIVFAWRATKTFFTLFEMIVDKSPLLKAKGIAFLIISLMCIVSLFVFILQVISYKY